MTSRTTKRFREVLSRLAQEVQNQARSAYKRFAENPYHPGLQFRQVHLTLPVYSARVGIHYRAVGTLAGDEIVWFWIGSHAEYDYLLAQTVASFPQSEHTGRSLLGLPARA
jgi:hypothetical protein